VLFLAGCSGGAAPRQDTIVIGSDQLTCDDATSTQDAYESALARARCEHPDMLVHPQAYVIRRVPSGPNVPRFAIEETHTGKSFCCYEVSGTHVLFRPR
jgi:hypothetical protein